MAGIFHVTAQMKRSITMLVILCNISLFAFAATFIEENPVAKEDLDFRINADNNTQMFILFTQQRSGYATTFAVCLHVCFFNRE